MRKYFDILSTELKNQVAYIPSFMLRNIFFIVIMLIFFALWSVVYSSGGFNGMFTLNQMIWYLTITECIELSKSRIYWDVQEEVKSGSIAYTIGRPYNYNLFQIFKSLGTSLIKIVPLLIMGFVIAFILVGFLPNYFKALPFGLIVIIGGVILNTIWYLIIGLFSFWVEDAFPFLLILQKLTFIFGGFFFPLEFLPKWSQGIVKVLPFSYSAYWPGKVVVDYDINTFIYVVKGQFIWTVVLLGAASLIFNSAVRRLHVQGG